MSEHDYSGIEESGNWLRPAGLRLAAIGLCITLFIVALGFAFYFISLYAVHRLESGPGW